MPPKRKGRALPPDAPPERHGVITLTATVQGAKLTVNMTTMGSLTIGEQAMALEFVARDARQQVGVEAAKAELVPVIEKLQLQAGDAGKKTAPPAEPPDTKRRRRL